MLTSSLILTGVILMDPVLTPPPNTHQQIDVTYILVGQAEDYRDVNVSFENWNCGLMATIKTRFISENQINW